MRPRLQIYELDPAAAETLSEQLTSNLRRAIANGMYKAGDRLPGIREMAEMCGTSVRIPIAAMKRLEEEGFVKSRPRIGCIVLGENRRVWRGNILLLHVGCHANYSQNAFANEISIRLESANWRVEHVFVERNGRSGGYDLGFLEKRLPEKHDLVLLPAFDPPVIETVKASGIPYVLLWAPPGEKRGRCVGTLQDSARRKVLGEFAAHCRERGVKHVLQLVQDGVGPSDLENLMPKGVRVESIVISPAMSPLRVESFSKCAYDSLLARLRNRRAPRPDVVYFDDDYFARGGFWALSALGLRVPDDIKVVTQTNYGNAPFCPIPLTRIEYDLYKDAANLTRSVLRFLKTGEFGGSVVGRIAYVRGETF